MTMRNNPIRAHSPNHHHGRFLLHSGLALFFSFSAFAQNGDPVMKGLVENLSSGDPQVRALARQALPRQGLEAVPAMIQLLGSNDGAAATASFDILMEIANEACTPGRGKDRKAVTDLLMPLVSPDLPEKERTLGMRLLERLVPPGYNVDPIAAMLTDKNLREKTRTTLQRIATDEAWSALIKALGEADPIFQVPLLNSLGELEDEGSLETFQKLAVTGTPEVQIAAIRALAWTGDPSFLKVAKTVRDNASDKDRVEATEALLQLVARVVNRGGNWEVAARTYEEILSSSEGAQKEAALAGLGEMGDERHVDVILDAIKEAPPRTFLVGIRALSRLQGAAPLRRLAIRYPDLPPATQQAVIPILAKSEEEGVAPILMAAAKSEDPAFRAAGLAALGQSGLREAIEVFLDVAAKGSAEEKKIVLTGLAKVGDTLGRKGKTHEACKAFLGLWNLAADAAGKERALRGIAAYPSPDGFDMAMGAAADPSLRDPAIAALQAVAGALVAVAQPEKALAAYTQITNLHPSAQTLQTVASGMKNLNADVNLAELVGFITRWSVVGPFDLGENKKGWDTPFVGEPTVDLTKAYPSGDKQVSWKQVKGTADIGKVDLLAEVAQCESCLAYAYAEFVISDETDVTLNLSVDDGAKVWLNGPLVLDHFRVGALVMDSEKAPVHLLKGKNTLLLKVYQNNLPWEFCLRFLTKDGVPVAVTQP
jgi:HEAT repeat protein